MSQSFRALRKRILQGAAVVFVALIFAVYAWGVDPTELLRYLIISLMLVVLLILPAALMAALLTWWRGRRQ